METCLINPKFFKKNLQNKKGFQISFAWLFAIIVGAFILFLAIFAATRIIETGEEVVGARAAAELGGWMRQLETGFEAAVTLSLSTQLETRIYNRCNNATGNFGRQSLGTSTYSFGEWSAESIEARMPDRYIFSNETIEGRDFFASFKPFEFPFKVADLIYLTSAEDIYCFKGNIPPRIERECDEICPDNVHLENSENNGECPAGSIRVCFNGREGCNINEGDVIVDYNRGIVEQSNGTHDFELNFATDALMYAAIFSEKEIYECQVSRLMMRTKHLLMIYGYKADEIDVPECRYGPLMDEFSSFRGVLSSLQSDPSSGSDLERAKKLSEEIGDLNDRGRVECRLW